MPKRIILLLDGTWNDADRGPSDTNIVRMREIISSCLLKSAGDQKTITPQSATVQTAVIAGDLHSGTDVVRHLVYYERGVGTGGFLDNVRGGAFGAGLSRNVRRAYLFLARNYEPGDQIFVFGFSRGSFTARSLVGYINNVGILKEWHCSEEKLSECWYYYRSLPQERLPTTLNKIHGWTHPNDFRISCLGVFDTVGALGVPIGWFALENRDLFGFHDVAASSKCDWNFHALAIDEHRESFEATLWRQAKFVRERINVEQVWFAGAHSDIGGGYVDEDERRTAGARGLDDITLDWMLRRVTARFADFPVRIDARHPGATQPDWRPQWIVPDRSFLKLPHHEPRKGFWRFTPYSLRTIGNLRHKAGWHEKVVCLDRHADPTNEMVHISALMRLGRPVGSNALGLRTYYRPKNLISALDEIEATYSGGGKPKAVITVADWSGEVFDVGDPDHQKRVLGLVRAARRRLNRRRGG